MTLVVVCPDCTYGSLGVGQDPNGKELASLMDIHNRTFKHNAVVRQANMEDMIRFSKKDKSSTE